MVVADAVAEHPPERPGEPLQRASRSGADSGTEASHAGGSASGFRR